MLGCHAGLFGNWSSNLKRTSLPHSAFDFGAKIFKGFIQQFDSSWFSIPTTVALKKVQKTP